MLAAQVKFLENENALLKAEVEYLTEWRKNKLRTMMVGANFQRYLMYKDAGLTVDKSS